MKLPAAIAIQIGMVGAMGQAVLLCHSLQHAYPYKLMWHPGAQFYSSVGYAGLVVGPAAAFAAMLAARRRTLAALPALAVTVCPGAVRAVFEVASVWTGADAYLGGGNIDGWTHGRCRAEFAAQVDELVVAGVLVGVAVGGVIWGVTAWLARNQASGGATAPPN